MIACAGLTACGDAGASAPPEAGPPLTQDVTEHPADDGAAGDGAAGDGAAGDGAAGDGAAGDGGAAAMCLAAISFEGRTYVGVQVPELPVGDEAGQAVTPPCNDTGAAGESDEQPSAAFPVLAIDGVDPSVAVATEAQGSDGYWIWYTSDDLSSQEPPPAVQKLIDAAS